MRKLILTVCVLFGFLLLLGAGLEARRFAAEKQWPTVEGEIIEAKLFETEGSAWLELKYRFEAAGTTYTDDGTLDVDGIDAVPAKYREGQVIAVHYDPKDPTRTYLQFAGFESPVGLTVMGAVVLAVCAPFAFGWIRYEGD